MYSCIDSIAIFLNCKQYDLLKEYLMTSFALPRSESEFKEWILELVNTLLTIMEEKDGSLKKHSKRVADNSFKINTSKHIAYHFIDEISIR